MSRGASAVCAGLVIGAGLLLRLVPWGLPLPVHHYGGGLLWGAMLYCLAAAVRPGGWDRGACAAVAGAVAAAIEFTRLVHTPELDAFRTKLPGQLALGRIFSAWNLLVYAAGIAAAAALGGRLRRVLAA